MRPQLHADKEDNQRREWLLKSVYVTSVLAFLGLFLFFLFTPKIITKSVALKSYSVFLSESRKQAEDGGISCTCTNAGVFFNVFEGIDESVFQPLSCYDEQTDVLVNDMSLSLSSGEIPDNSAPCNKHGVSDVALELNDLLAQRRREYITGPFLVEYYTQLRTVIPATNVQSHGVINYTLDENAEDTLERRQTMALIRYGEFTRSLSILDACTTYALFRLRAIPIGTTLLEIDAYAAKVKDDVINYCYDGILNYIVSDNFDKRRAEQVRRAIEGSRGNFTSPSKFKVQFNRLMDEIRFGDTLDFYRAEYAKKDIYSGAFIEGMDGYVSLLSDTVAEVLVTSAWNTDERLLEKYFGGCNNTPGPLICNVSGKETFLDVVLKAMPYFNVILGALMTVAAMVYRKLWMELKDDVVEAKNKPATNSSKKVGTRVKKQELMDSDVVDSQDVSVELGDHKNGNDQEFHF